MFQVLVILICLLLNAILSCIEMAFVTVSRAHLKQLAVKKNISAQRILKLKENPERTLSVLQIGITLVGAISAAVGGASADTQLTPYFQDLFSISRESANVISILAVVIPLTYLNVVIGELVPKSLALRFPLRLVFAGAILLKFLDKVFAPFIYILEISTRVILTVISKGMPAEKLSEANTSIDIEPLSDQHKQYVFNLVHVDKKSVLDIFIPWENVSLLNIEDHYQNVMKTIKESRHTRLPVMKEDRVVGLLHAKEFVSELEISRLDWTQLIRPAVKINPKEPILAVLKKLQSNNSHIGLVMNGAEPLGIVTIQDIFEEFIGELSDEDDNARVLLSTNVKIRSQSITRQKN